MKLTILMPCLNEAKTLPGCIRDAQSFLDASGLCGEILVADNGSVDGSPGVAEALGARVIHVPQRGYGAALRAGIAAASGDLIIMGDADESYDFKNLAPFVREIEYGADLVMGNRFAGGISKGAMPLLHRYLGNPVLSWLGRRFFKIAVRDFHCGLRGFKKESILHLGLVSPGMEFASEMVAKAALAGLNISEVPTTLKRDGRGRPPHLRTWRDGFRHLFFMLLLSPRWLFLWPGVALLTIGVFGFLLLQGGTVAIGDVGLGVHSLLYSCASIIIGTQLTQFAFLIKSLAVSIGFASGGRWFARIREALPMELGALFGIALFIAGLTGSVAVTQGWMREGFQELDPSVVMRSVIPAVTVMIVGIQLCVGFCVSAAVRQLMATGKGRRDGED